MADKEVGFTLKVNGTDKAVRSINDVEQALVELQKEAKGMDLGSSEFERVQGEMRKAQAQLKEFRADTKKIKEVKDQFTDMGSGIGNSMNLAEDSLRAFGIESKGLSTIVQVSNAIITATNGIRAASEAKVEQSVARKAVVEKAAAMATKVWTGIQAAFNAVMAMNPIGLVIIAIGALIAAVVLLWSPIKKLTDNFKFLGDAVSYVWDLMRDFASFMTGGLINDAATSKTLENNQKIIDSFNDVNSAQNKLVEGSKDYENYIKALGATEEQLMQAHLKTLDNEMAKMETHKAALEKAQKLGQTLKEDELKFLSEYQVNKTNIEQEGLNSILAYNTKANADKLAKEKEAYNKSLELQKAYAKEISDKTREAQGNLLKLQQEGFLQSLATDRDRQAGAILIATSNSKALIDIEIAKLDARGKLSKKELDLRKLYLDQIAQLELNAGTELQDLYKKFLAEDAVTQKEADDKRLADAKAANEKEIEDKLAFYAEQDNIALQRRDYENANMDNTFAKMAALRQAAYDDEYYKLGEMYTNKEEYDKAVAELDIKYAELAASQKAKVIMDFAAFSLDTAAGTIGDIASLEETGSKKWKALKISEVIISGISAGIKTWAGYAEFGPFGTAAAIIQTAAIIASTAIAVNKIRSTPMGGGTGGGGGGGDTPKPEPSKFAGGGSVNGPGTSVSDSINASLSNGESVMNANTTSMFGGLLSALNQSGGGKALENVNPESAQPIFKTYVIASDVTSQQEANKKIADLARI